MEVLEKFGWIETSASPHLQPWGSDLPSAEYTEGRNEIFRSGGTAKRFSGAHDILPLFVWSAEHTTFSLPPPTSPHVCQPCLSLADALSELFIPVLSDIRNTIHHPLSLRCCFGVFELFGVGVAVVVLIVVVAAVMVYLFLLNSWILIYSRLCAQLRPTGSSSFFLPNGRPAYLLQL